MKSTINVINELVVKVSVALQKNQWKLATVESITGGGLSYFITSLSGSSDWFDCGIITYSNTAKIELLDVKAKTIESCGAVSKEVACAMAEGALIHSHANISVAITGIAGPKGGTPQKPVGTVWMAWSRLNTPTASHLYSFSGDREAIRLASILKALEKLLDFIP